LTIYIFEPLGTTKRFIVLALLFIPVILTAPMLLVGRRREGGRRRGRRLSKKDKGQRWGAVWWFGFLVKQMERAGPTFIKVSKRRGGGRLIRGEGGWDISSPCRIGSHCEAYSIPSEDVEKCLGERRKGM